MYRQITGKGWMRRLVVTDSRREGTWTASNLRTRDFYKNVKWSWKIRLGGNSYLIHHSALGTSWCFRKFLLEIWLWGHSKSKFPLRARGCIHIHCYIFIQCRDVWGLCRQTRLIPEILRRWRKTPLTWARKWDFAPPWETSSNLVTPLFTSHTNVGLYHGKRAIIKVFPLSSNVGREVVALGQGC